MEERNSRYELQPSRNGLTVPVINGVYLHSIYNPTKEAETFAESHRKNLTYKKSVLVLGLGFGYHVEHIAKILHENHSEYEILIVEPNQKLVEDFLNIRSFEDKNIKILSSTKVKELFSNKSFVSFLMKKPAIIKHDASFILEKDFFTGLLSYKAPKDILTYKSILTQDSINLFSDREARSIDDHIEKIQSEGKIRSRNEFLLMALHEMTANSIQGRNE